MKDTLDQWEANALEFLEGKTHVSFESIDCRILNEKIIRLIDLVREKDEALSYFKGADRCEIAIWSNGSLSVGQPNPNRFTEALALTEQLKG